jgi:four helix bundle protein
MEKKYQGFEGLEVYQAARAFRIKISGLCKYFPADERYVLRKQLLRCARSISANIAEGYGRFYFPEFIQFCRIARGSLNETLDHLICAADEGFISAGQLEDCKSDFHRILRLLNGFIQYLNKQLSTKKQTMTTTTNTTNTTITTNTTLPHA